MAGSPFDSAQGRLFLPKREEPTGNLVQQSKPVIPTVASPRAKRRNPVYQLTANHKRRVSVMPRSPRALRHLKPNVCAPNPRHHATPA